MPARLLVRPSARWIAGLLGVLIVAGAAPSWAAGARDVVAAWSARLDERATELETAPKVRATRVGGGIVLKKGDGGMIEVAAPTPAPAAPAPVPAAVEGQPESPVVQPQPPLIDPPLPPMFVRAAAADRVGRLSSRLIELGFLREDQWTDAYDDTLDAAVRAFQLAEGLMPDGKVGEVTRLALDRTPAQAAALMRRASAAMRAFQASVPDTVVLVNLPSQTVTYIDRGRVAQIMRAVVGRPSRQTPLMEDRITSVTVNPTWTVPPTVLVEDKLPVLRKKGNTGIKNAIVYLDGAEVVPETVNWWSVGPERIRIVQRPGDDNALGRFRFNLTNGEGIFLHGTNDPKLFDRDVRAASSGCVRLADARGMAEALLAAKKIAPADIDRQLDSGETKTIALPKAVAVRFVYWTASVEPGGVVRVHPDIYDDASGAPAPVSTSMAKPKAPDIKALQPKTLTTRTLATKSLPVTPAAAPESHGAPFSHRM
ncbi:MAG TPA: L,D-transpeptidase family protein [Azospirillum sp.]